MDYFHNSLSYGNLISNSRAIIKDVLERPVKTIEIHPISCMKHGKCRFSYLF
jgi:hypothetical protein